MIQGMLLYIQQNASQIGTQIGEHLYVSLLSLAIAALIGIPAGYFASLSPVKERILSIPFQILRVVPSLALLFLFIPIMGTGVRPAVTALTILAIPPILLNTIVGFNGVPAFMLECASGIGMTGREQFWHVRLPQALPMILAGVRSSLVEVIASATLAAMIGAGGLGEIIFTGLGLFRADILLAGGLLVALLSLGSGLVFDLIQRVVLRYRYV
ncbi:MAG: ABC transporter permease [Eubacterium sp.]|nr:ABC transporter permease [Eubacterium sp.]